MMASSQVEIATSSPFGCAAVHNHRDPCFQNNLNNSRHIDFADLWVHRPQWQSTTTANINKCNHSNDDRSIDYKDKWARAREMVFSVDHRSANSKGGGSSDSSKQSEEVSNSGGVSSLVQKWRGFEAKCSSRNSNTAGTTMFQDNAGDEPSAAPATNEDDPFGDWESDRTAFSAPTSSDASEMERLRVADIIRKLTEDRFSDVGCDSPPRVRTSSSDQSEQRCHSPVVCSPRIRGRQAYNDLLMQMGRDRQKELEGLVGRKPVSKFSHRGRIQALLRFRFLRRGIEAREDRHSNNTSHKAVRPVVMHIRERVDSSAQNGSVHSASCRKEMIDSTPTHNQQGNENQVNEDTNSKSLSNIHNIQDSQDSITSTEHDVNHSSHIVNEDIQHNVDLLHSYEHLHHETSSPLSTFMRQETIWENSNHSLADSAESSRNFHNTEINFGETTKSLPSIEISVHDKNEEATDHQVTENIYDLTGYCAQSQSYHKGESVSDQDFVESDMYWVNDGSNPEVGWEELQQEEGSNKEWIDEVSRPRSDWEDLRQARYQEMLDPFLDNEEIRSLLGRIIRQKKKTHERLPEQEQTVVSEQGEGGDEEDEQDGGEDFGDYIDEYEEAESSVGQQYNESDDSTDQITSSSPSSWPQNQGHELSDYSYHVATPSTQQSSNYYSQDNGPNSSYSAPPAIEMDLIYDLRGHMEQLHQEMSDLKKSIKCCMDMQIKLQNSIKKEVAIALRHSDVGTCAPASSVLMSCSGAAGSVQYAKLQ
ncbi:hypothetical protein DH2020_036834 [Rehmannia glutinosa]|uniref:Uncharacterized protein n=1 Tax=Rehmannia glutinosa TaxID=99300 RepID=A0ABR0V4A7_REHGL